MRISLADQPEDNLGKYLKTIATHDKHVTGVGSSSFSATPQPKIVSFMADIKGISLDNSTLDGAAIYND